MPAYNAAKTLERTYRDIPHEIIDRIIDMEALARLENIHPAPATN